LTTALPSALAPIEITGLHPIRDHVLIEDMQFKERFTTGGIYLPSDDGKAQGIRPRWGKVFAIGPDQVDVQVGQYICVAHGRWTRAIKIKDATGIHEIRRVDNDDILLISDEPVSDDTMGRPL
jgi:co-chaperonin GroES (HSP10)